MKTGRWSTKEEIIQVIGAYFYKLFSSEPGMREETVRLALKPITTEEDNLSLTAVPSEAEIKEAAHSINADKHPGRMGSLLASSTLIGRT